MFSAPSLISADKFSGRPSEFQSLFHRILSMALDHSHPPIIRTHLVSFITSAFQALDNSLVRKECAPIVSIAIWQNLSSERIRDAKLEGNSHLKKAWRAAAKRYEAATDTAKAKIRFDRSWLYSMSLDFLDRLYDSPSTETGEELYCERFLELLIDLEGQLPTRRYVNSLLHDLNILPAIKLSPKFNEEKNELLRDLYALLRHFAYFAVNDYTGSHLSLSECYEAHYKQLANLQRVALKHFKDKLTILALSNYASIDKRNELEIHFSTLTNQELLELCARLGLRTEYSRSAKLVLDRAFFTEVILSSHERVKDYRQVAADLSICPAEDALFDPALLRNEKYNSSRPLAIPKLNLQYLTVGDFLWRSFILHRCESFYQIRRDIEETVNRLRPRTLPGGGLKLDGFSRMGLLISRPSILEVAPPRVGDDKPSNVRAEVTLDYTSLGENIRREWDSLRPGDVVFLLALQGSNAGGLPANGTSPLSAAEAIGLKHLRTAEVIQLSDESGRPIRDPKAMSSTINGYPNRGRLRKLILSLDAAMYKVDMDRVTNGKLDIYDGINLIVRRKGRENNFKPILESIQNLITSDIPLPSWLQEVFLGYGDAAGASYTHLPNRLRVVDFRDTFLDWQHVIDSLPGRVVQPYQNGTSSSGPLYVLETVQPTVTMTTDKPSNKRRRDEPDVLQQQQDMVKVSTYKPGSSGPYPTDAPKFNHVRFTPRQVEAIISGTQPGLTIIVGPPGTGKTDVATQIINNIYHNFPNQRTLLIAHSNQALNQLFQKIVALDIDERHLLRLGHGEEELETAVNYGKHGRVDSFLQNRTYLLGEVDRLAENFVAPGAHGNSCETAAYFNIVYVQPAWKKFQEGLESSEIAPVGITESFPFNRYFSNAPQPLFPPEATVEELKEISMGCYRHIEKIFSELEDIRPFEILRNSRDKANYLLVKEARIIAMTSTHAAMRRQEITHLGFHYDNVVMEEAAQITEIETFIPLALQKSKDGDLPLQRVVLCGDHLQNSPIIQNLAFRQYANLEQSLFLRMIRLGVPTIELNQQGRARPSIARLYSWRYKELGNLPIVETAAQFKKANAGLRYEYQFIDVPDYKGVGEAEPSPHFIQNLGEAEYAVALYQYMRLLGYPSSAISILTTYAGQRALIKDVLGHRCAKNPLFGLPRIVTTVDKYQGEQNDCESLTWHVSLNSN